MRLLGISVLVSRDSNNTQYSTLEDFHKAIEELKAAFPEPGVVSDHPVVVTPYGFC